MASINRTIKRKILVTLIRKPNGDEDILYGRFDAVALARREYKIIKSELHTFTMTEEDFAVQGHQED